MHSSKRSTRAALSIMAGALALAAWPLVSGAADSESKANAIRPVLADVVEAAKDAETQAVRPPTVACDAPEVGREPTFEAAAQLLSTCDPEGDLTQECCDALSAAIQNESVSELADAWRTCGIPDTVAAGDCLDASCSGATSCKWLKKGCNFINGNFNCTRSDSGACTSGTCKKCFD